MGATYSLGAYLEDDSITLEDVPSKQHPDGKAYRFESPSFEVGLWLKNLLVFGRRAALATELAPHLDDEAATAENASLASELGKLVLDDDEEVDVYRRVMGATFDELRADEVSWGHVQEVFGLLLRHWGSAQTIDDALAAAAAASVAAEGDGSGEPAAQPNRAARRASGTGSSPKAGSKSSRASTATKGRTGVRGSTRSSATSGKPARKAPAKKAAAAG